MLQTIDRCALFCETRGWAFFLVVLGGSILITVGLFVASFSGRWWGWLVFISGTILFSLGGVYSDLKSISKKYEETFGLEFPINAQERMVQQPAINAILQSRANAFRECCDKKSVLLRSLPPSDSTASIEETQPVLLSLKQIEGEIRDRKESFWQAHSLARRAGMWTLKKHGDYLRLKRHIS